MYEEYLNSKEIVQKIADLKIRLALQQEFEQEVDKLVAEVNPTDAGQTRKIREMEERCSGTSLLTRADESSGMSRNGDSLDMRAL